MPANPSTINAIGALLPGLAVTLALLALTACSPAADDPTPRLLTPQELRAGIEEARIARPTAASDIEGRAAALRGRAAALRSHPVTPAEDTDALRRRARELATTAP